MPAENTEKIINAAVYIEGKPIVEIQEIELPAISVAREKFINKLKKLIRTEILVFKIKHKIRGIKIRNMLLKHWKGS